MKEYGIEYTLDFWVDINAAMNYIAFELANEIAARRLYHRVLKKTVSLRFSPKVHHLKDNIYSARIGHYVIIYLVNDTKNMVTFLHFWYSRKNIAKLLR